jgi:hypothetical protein
VNLRDFVLEKIAKEFAPGIPKRGVIRPIRSAKNEEWNFGIQRHEARKAGIHHDLRLADPQTGVAYSWALRYLPKPGQRTLAIRQSDHTPEYMSFTGTIPEGYGAGEVLRHRLEKADVISSSPGLITFNAYPGKTIEEFALINTTGDKWILFNKTPGEGYKVPSSKPKYKEKQPEDVMHDPKEIMMGKIDGGHLTYDFKSKQPVRAFSYRPSERQTGPIQHTDRIEGMRQTKAPQNLDDTVVRGETVAVGPKGKALPARELGGILNSNVWKARNTLKAKKAKLHNYIFDVERYRGEHYADKPYKEKHHVLKLIAASMPHLFKLPPTAETHEEKVKLFDKIKKGKEPLTREGVVLWNKEESKPATKIKFKPEYDIKIHGVFPSSKKGEAGGFTFENVDGKKVKLSRVGTGFSRQLKMDMAEHPEKYVGLIAKVKAMGQMPSGALRASSFQSWHLDKNPTDKIPEIKK